MFEFLGSILTGIISLVGSCIWELLKTIGGAIGTAIGSLLSGILTGISAGILALVRVLALPVLIIGLFVFVCLMVWKAFFS